MKALDVIWLAGADADMIRLYARLGDRFYHQVHESVEQIRWMPESAPVYLGRFRRLVIAQTPFGLFYCVEGSRVMISALLDLRMSPERIRERLVHEF